MKKYTLLLSVLFISFIIFTSCKKEGCTDPDATNFDANADKDDGSCIYNQPQDRLPSLHLAVHHMVAGAALKKDMIMYTNAAGNEYGISRVRYYISDVTLYTTGGDSVFMPYFHYIDAIEQQTAFSVVADEIPEGNYDAIKFNFGLTPRLNHLDSMPNTEPHASFAWPHMMGGGYHYMQFEGRYRHSATETRFYNTHMGHLKNSSADVDPSFAVKFSIPAIQSVKSVSSSGYTIIFEADLNEWYQNPNTYNFADYANGTMGNPQALQKLKENGRSVFSFKDILIAVE